MAMPEIRGTVTLEGKPVGRAYARLYGPSGEFVSERYTPDDGRFVFHVVPGTWTMEARAAGAGDHTTTLQVSDEEVHVEIDLEPGS